MPALQPGKTAPEISLPDVQGRRFSWQQTLNRGPLVLVFFKVSCPVCQYALPFVERLYRAHKGKVSVVGVSQNPKPDTEAFLRQYDISFPVLLDDTTAYPVSNAYGLTNVPTTFLISTGGEIEVSSVGWSRQGLEEINRRVSKAVAAPPAALFLCGEEVPDFTAG
jgi:peroxiredoxin